MSEYFWNGGESAEGEEEEEKEEEMDAMTSSSDFVPVSYSSLFPSPPPFFIHTPISPVFIMFLLSFQGERFRGVVVVTPLPPLGF